MTYSIPIEVTVRIEVVMEGDTLDEAVINAEEYWARNYDDTDDPSFVEGRYVPFTANPSSHRAKKLTDQSAPHPEGVINEVRAFALH